MVSSTRRTEPDNPAPLITVVGVVLSTLAWWFGLPSALILLLALIVRGAAAKYPTPARRTDQPDKRKLAAYYRYRNFWNGVRKPAGWLTWRVSGFTFPLLGVLLSIRSPYGWAWVLNVAAMMPVGAGWRFKTDRRVDHAHPCPGVSVRSFARKAAKGWRRTVLTVLGLTVVMAAVLWWQGRGIPLPFILTVGALASCLLVYLSDRKRQTAGWKRIVDAQKLIDSWTVKGMPLEKSFESAYVVQADSIGGQDPLTVIRVKLPMGTVKAVKDGSQAIKPLAKSAGYNLCLLLQARVHGLDTGIDPQCVRLVLGRDVKAIPDIGKPVDYRLASLVTDIAYQRTADLWRRAAPLTKTVSVAKNPDSDVAWKVELTFPVGATVDMHIVSRDWLADDSTSPVSILSLPVYADVDEKFHLYAKDGVELDDKTRPVVQAGRRVKTLMDAWKSILPSKLSPPYPEASLEQTLSEDGLKVTVTPLQVPQGGELSDYARCDVNAIDPDGVFVGLVKAQGQAVQVTVDGNVSLGYALFDSATLAKRMIFQSWLYMTVCRLLKGRVAVGMPTLMGVGKPIWRVVLAYDGATSGDVRKILPQLKSTLGCKVAVMEQVGVDRCALWLMDKPYVTADDARWFKRDQSRFIRLWLADAWAAVGLTAKDGSGPMIESLNPLRVGSRVLKARFRLPLGKSMSNVDALLDKFLVSAGYQYGRLLPRGDEHGADLWDMILCDRNPLPATVPLPRDVSGMRFGVDDMGNPVAWDLAHTPHLSVMGKTGTGKSSVTRVMVLQALLDGWQVVICDPMKHAADFDLWAKRLTVAWAVSMDDAEAAVGWVHERMMERSRLNAKHGVGHIKDLPDEVRPQRILLVFDEFNSYLAGMDDKTIANPTNDMDIANRNADTKNRVRSITVTAGRMADIAVQGRSLGVHMVLGSQRLSRDDMRKVPNVNAFYRSLGRFLLGSDSLAGVVSQTRLKEANRMQKGLAGVDGVPAGRGVYEDVQGALTAVQSYWDGDQEALIPLVADLPDVVKADISPWLPAGAEHYGEIADKTTPDEQSMQVDEPDVDSVEIDEVGEQAMEWNI